jgi:hypothetical protein
LQILDTMIGGIETMKEGGSACGVGGRPPTIASVGTPMTLLMSVWKAV